MGRLETILAIPDLHSHEDLLHLLNVDGMSSDEEDNVHAQLRDTAVNPSYHVLTPRWRSKELTTFLHVLDSLYIIVRRFDSNRQRGNWPRPRRYDSLNPTFSRKTDFPKNLPQNAYNEQWLNAFPNVKLSVNPTMPYNFTHSPNIFQYLLTMSGTIFRVTTGRSFTKFPSVKDGVLTNPIQFAHQAAESSFLQSTLNREFGRNRDVDTERGLNGSVDKPAQTQTSIIRIAQEKRNDGGDAENVG
ncbi:hypothetical protein EST38_g9216 [Candolleomyces aberdarensis]|uniref:Uncharacterized protein n=1 Tax=Candolleomyces aberdarensis TaxID=2316362 RepID=A0A4Q2DBA6_9AGAR|nr:hypothetical protein EST38_g9216 [Candolleomyces aberdarensis]